MITDNHTHSNACWWNPAEARWECPPTDTTAPERAPLDVRDMLVVHTAMLREFRLAPAAVARVPAGDHRRARIVDAHLRLIHDMLHHHHAGEDALLWPVLCPRVSAADALRIDDAERQHEAIGAALERVEHARRAWISHVTGPTTEALTDALRALHEILAEHLDAEERVLLPLAARHLSEQEWHAIGKAAVAAMRKQDRALVFGMLAYEADPDVLRDMLRAAPPPARVLLPRVAPRLYARRAALVHGTARP